MAVSVCSSHPCSQSGVTMGDKLDWRTAYSSAPMCTVSLLNDRANSYDNRDRNQTNKERETQSSSGSASVDHEISTIPYKYCMSNLS